MARKLSKKKISGWILLFSVIAFFKCGGYDYAREQLSKIQATIHQHPTQNTHHPSIDTALTHRLDSFVTTSQWDRLSGIYIYDVTAGKQLYAHNADEKMRPASNMKMLTSISALRYLGPNYNLCSSVCTDGRQIGDSLTGNLIFRFAYDLHFNDSCLRKLVGYVDKAGIRRVGGKILLDLPLHEGIQHEEHWIPGDYRHSKTNMLFKGETVMKRNLQYALASTTNLKVNAGQIEVIKGFNPLITRKLEVIKGSDPLITPITAEIERALLNSSNENAEAISFLLGDKLLNKNQERTSQLQRSYAARRLRGFIQNQMHMNPDSVATIHDGSGLCIHDRLTPRFMVQLLLYAREHQYIYKVLEKYLPVAGETGTLQKRMRAVREHCLKNNRPKLQAKTGTLTREDGITSLSGFCTGANGHLLFFGIIQNGIPVADARLFQDKFCLQMIK